MNRPARAHARAAVFFDRDGTLNHEVEGALSRADQLELTARAGPAVKRVNDAGLLAIVISNQSAIARGRMTHADLEVVHGALRERLRAQSARLDDIRVCPHLEDDGFPPYRRTCECRKPRPGLLLDAAAHWNLKLADCWLIGDALRDLKAAAAAGCKSILVRTGKGELEARRLKELEAKEQPLAVTNDVLEAVEFALAARAKTRPQGR